MSLRIRKFMATSLSLCHQFPSLCLAHYMVLTLWSISLRLFGTAACAHRWPRVSMSNSFRLFPVANLVCQSLIETIRVQIAPHCCEILTLYPDVSNLPRKALK